MSDSQELRGRVGRIEELVQQLESTADPASRAAVKELMQALLDLHGGGFERIIEIVSQAGESGDAILKTLGRDALVSSLLVLYELHPEDFETRARRGLEKAGKFARSRGAAIDVLAMGAGSVTVQIAITGHSCGSTAREIETEIREALFETVPDATAVVIEVPGQAAASSFVPIANLQPTNGAGKAGAANGHT